MGKEYKEKEYGELLDALDHCEKGSEARCRENGAYHLRPGTPHLHLVRKDCW